MQKNNESSSITSERRYIYEWEYQKDFIKELTKYELKKLQQKDKEYEELREEFPV